MENAKLVEYAALAESASSHPISKSLQRAYGKEIDRSRVTSVQEISGRGVIATVDGMEIVAGNDKLMKQLQVTYIDCHHVGNNYSYGDRWKLCWSYCDIGYCERKCKRSHICT